MTDAEIDQSKLDHAYQRAWNRVGVRWGTPSRWSNAYHDDAGFRLVFDHADGEVLMFTKPRKIP